MTTRVYHLLNFTSNSLCHCLCPLSKSTSLARFSVSSFFDYTLHFHIPLHLLLHLGLPPSGSWTLLLFLHLLVHHVERHELVEEREQQPGKAICWPSTTPSSSSQILHFFKIARTIRAACLKSALTQFPVWVTLYLYTAVKMLSFSLIFSRHSP